MRSFAQYLIDGQDLSWHRIKFTFDPLNPGYKVDEADTYAGPLGNIFATGKNVGIGYFGADLDVVVKKLSSYKAHFFVCLPQFIETLVHNFGESVFEKINVRLFITYGNLISPEVRQVSDRLGIPIRANYSCEECGLIGSACLRCPDHYHIAQSNVIVETGDEKVEHEGVTCGNVLVTSIYSYATPIIRYELGDFASVVDECPCGYKGPTINKLLGRLSTTLRLPDGKRIPFHLYADYVRKVISFSDLKVRQTGAHDIDVQIVSDDTSDEAKARATNYFQSFCGNDFSINVQFRDRIDWGGAQKRLAFLSEV